jgi:hypothetical protein
MIGVRPCRVVYAAWVCRFQGRVSELLPLWWRRFNQWVAIVANQVGSATSVAAAEDATTSTAKNTEALINRLA